MCLNFTHVAWLPTLTKMLPWCRVFFLFGFLVQCCLFEADWSTDGKSHKINTPMF